MKGDFDNNLPIYQQIIEQILTEIASGVLSPGEKVAPVRDLAAQYKVNPNTMQKALAKLEDGGYLFTERTSGRFVTRDTELIQGLRTNMTASVTNKYIKEMQDIGMTLEQILDYVTNHIKGSGSQNG